MGFYAFLVDEIKYAFSAGIDDAFQKWYGWVSIRERNFIIQFSHNYDALHFHPVEALNYMWL